LLWELEVIRAQIAAAGNPPSVSPFDVLRRKYLEKLHQKTGRAVILYATAYLEPKANNVEGQALSVNLGDVQGFMEACHKVPERELDLVITSPGGSPEAAESIMAYLRTQFDSIRAVIPLAAMSAATMMSLAADEIVMGSHSQLGPIDPQFTLGTPEGPRVSPAQAILDQFDLGKQECQNPANIGAWLPLLRSLSPGLLAQCIAAREMAEQAVKESLERYMFAGDPDATAKADAASKWFADFKSFKSHGRRVSRDDARTQKLKVTDLEQDPELQDLVLSVHHAARITFNNSGVTKIIENHNGDAYIEQLQQLQIITPPPPPPGGQPHLRALRLGPCCRRQVETARSAAVSDDRRHDPVRGPNEKVRAAPQESRGAPINRSAALLVFKHRHRTSVADSAMRSRLRRV
jgi:hypothetical protein